VKTVAGSASLIRLLAGPGLRTRAGAATSVDGATYVGGFRDG